MLLLLVWGNIVRRVPSCARGTNEFGAEIIEGLVLAGFDGESLKLLEDANGLLTIVDEIFCLCRPPSHSAGVN